MLKYGTDLGAAGAEERRGLTSGQGGGHLQAASPPPEQPRLLHLPGEPLDSPESAVALEGPVTCTFLLFILWVAFRLQPCVCQLCTA